MTGLEPRAFELRPVKNMKLILVLLAVLNICVYAGSTSTERIYNSHNQVVATLETDGFSSKIRCYDKHHQFLGEYDGSTNTTYDAHHQILGKGNLLPALIPLSDIR